MEAKAGETGRALRAAPSAKAPRQPLVIVVAAFTAGILLDRLGEFGVVGWWFLAVGCWVSWWFLWKHHREAAAAGMLLLAVAGTGGAWHHLRWDLFPSEEIGRFARLDPQPVCLEGVARRAPERIPAPWPSPLRAIPQGERSRLWVQVEKIRDGTDWLPVTGRCPLLVDGHLLGVKAGDQLRIFAKLRRPSEPRNPGEFDFATHARAERRLASLRSRSPDCVEIIEKSRHWDYNFSVVFAVRRFLDQVRGHGLRLLWQHVPFRQAPFATAILLGDRVGLPGERTVPFLATGTVHLLVVSGLHVGMMAIGLFAALRLGWLPRKMALLGIMVTVVMYALLAEARPPIMRASFLIVLMCIAAWIGRRMVGYNSLAAAALVVLAWNPGDLFRIGPQLSFLCVATLIWVGLCWPPKWQEMLDDPLERLIAKTKPPWWRMLVHTGRWNGQLLVVSGAVWLAALPLVLTHFHVVTPVALLMSPLVWPLMLASLMTGFGTMLTGWLFPPLAQLFGWACGLSLLGLETLVGKAASLSGSHFWVPGPAWWWVLGFYAGLIATMTWGPLLFSRRWWIGLLAAWIVVGMTPPLHRSFTRDGLDISFLAMGHGTCIVLETPDGKTLLYDAGSLASPDQATDTVAAYLWHRGITRIDAIVLSHADVDHYNGVPGLLERFDVRAVYVSPVMFDSFGATGSSEGPALLRERIKESGVPIREIWSGDQLQIGPEVVAQVLHPPRRGVVGNDNSNSITLVIEYAGRRLLLPGDLESPGIEDVMAELPQDCDVLMAPHHGSQRSDPPGFAAWSTPEWVVISGTDSDNLDSVIQTYQQAGAQVLCTDKTGTIQFSIRNDQVQCSTWLEQ